LNVTSKTKNKYFYAGVFSNGDWGDILVRGLVTGRVGLNGSANLFYADACWTGATEGRTSFSDFSDVAKNFNVEGDLRNLVTIDSLGTDSISSARHALVHACEQHSCSRISQWL
jgi:hypothetical protein